MRQLSAEAGPRPSGRLTQKTPSKITSRSELVVITHPIHPLVGQSLPVERQVRGLGRTCLVVRLPVGCTVAVPIDWTDRRPWPTPLQARGRSVRLHPQALCELRALITDLCSRDSNKEVDSASERVRVAADHDQTPDLRGASPCGAARAARDSRQRVTPGHRRSRQSRRGDR